MKCIWKCHCIEIGDFDLQIQSVPITTKVVNLIPACALNTSDGNRSDFQDR